LTEFFYRLYIYGGLDIREGTLSSMHYLHLTFLKGGAEAKTSKGHTDQAPRVEAWNKIND